MSSSHTWLGTVILENWDSRSVSRSISARLRSGDVSETTNSSAGILEVLSELGLGVMTWDFAFSEELVELSL